MTAMETYEIPDMLTVNARTPYTSGCMKQIDG